MNDYRHVPCTIVREHGCREPEECLIAIAIDGSPILRGS